MNQWTVGDRGSGPVGHPLTGTVRDRESGTVGDPVPETICIDGEHMRVRRAWPAGRGRIAVEVVTAEGGIRAGFLGAGGVEVLEAGRDPKLPGLERLLAGERHRPQPRLISSQPRLISHRPGKRAVIRLTDGTFAKCVRRGRTDAIIAGQTRAEAFSTGFILPHVIRVDESTVVLSRVPGVELHDPSGLGENWQRAWAQALDAWTLAGSGPEAASVPVHSPDAEVRVLEDWRDRAAGLLARADVSGSTLLDAVDALIPEIRGELLDSGAPSDRGERSAASDGDRSTASAGEREAATVTARNWGPIHRDLHDKQIMWDPVAGPGLLDVDTACRGERELDLGNLSAHAHWRTHQGIWSKSHAEAVLREISRVTSAAGLEPARVRAYERATLVRLACVYAFRPRWVGSVGRLLELAR